MSRGRYSWRDLVGEPQLCEGGRLASVVFCNPFYCGDCPVFMEALRELGVDRERFLSVAEKMQKRIPVRDGSCSGNLALCPSMEKDSRDRDEALLRLGWSPSRYLRFKYDMLVMLLGNDPRRLEKAFTVRLLRQFAVTALDLETRRVYKALALGNIDRGRVLFITETIDTNTEDSIEWLEETELVGVRIPKQLVRKLDELVERGIIQSRSDGLRRALALYLEAMTQSPLNTVNAVKPSQASQALNLGKRGNTTGDK